MRIYTAYRSGPNKLGRSGFTLMEVIVTIAIAAVVLSGLIAVLNQVGRYRSTTETLTRIVKIKTALAESVRQTALFAERNCFGWTGACSGLSLTPHPLGMVSGSILRVSATSENVTKLFRQAGCTASPVGNMLLNVTCMDGYGRNFLFQPQTPFHHVQGSIYTLGYLRTPFSLRIRTDTSTGNPDIEGIWSMGAVDAELFLRSEEKARAIENALKTYAMQRLVSEAITNTCDPINGGLLSFDDVIIPWAWQALGTAPNAECTGIEAVTCGCWHFNSFIWRTSALSGDVWLNTDIELTTLLNNIGIGTSVYRTDGYGNNITIGLLTDATGNLLGGTGIPPRPHPHYNWGSKPPFGGIVGVRDGGTWRYYRRIMYPQ
ncbi:MAG: hypothetical protein DDT19_01497 [Syntrophomonadaceae bacterium]|nr:hypothetical protein [Bacillota bacterium]